MECSIEGIAKSVVSEDKTKTIANVKKLSTTTPIQRAEASARPMAILVDVLRLTKPSLNGKTVHLLNVKRDELGEFTLKYKIEGSEEVMTTVLESRAEFDTESNNFNMDKNSVERLYSDGDVIHNFDDFNELALDITNNPEKIMDVAKHLIEADEYHNDEPHNALLYNQLGRITEALKEIVPEMNVYINEAGEANYGILNLKENRIEIAKGERGSKSLMEIYVHELYHAVTHYAITAGSADVTIRPYTARMEQIRDNFLKNTTEADLVTSSGEILTEEQAAKLLDHLTDPKVGLHEFVALSMSNKAVMYQLMKLDTNKRKVKGDASLFYKLLDAVYGIFKAVKERVSKEPRGHDLGKMVFLTAQLYEAHKKPLKAKQYAGITNLLSIFNPIERKWVAYVNKKIEEDQKDITRNARKKGESKTKYTARLAARSLIDDQARDAIRNTLSLASFRSGYSPFSPENSLMSVIRDFVESDKTQDEVEQRGMVSQTIDQLRKFTDTAGIQLVIEAFKRTLLESEEVSLTRSILETDLSSIFYNYDIKNLLKDNKEIDKEIDTVLSKLDKLESKESVNYYNYQTSLLSDFMIKGNSHIALMLNAYNIASKLGTAKENLAVSEEVINLVDELTTLKALRTTKKEDKATLLALIEEQPEAVDLVVGMQLGMKNKSEKELFATPTDRFKIVKGYTADIVDADIDVSVFPLSETAKLKRQGYELVKELSKHEMDKNDTPMGMFVNNKVISQTYHRVGLRITDTGSFGSTVTQSYSSSGTDNITLRASQDIKNMRTRKQQVTKQMFDGTYEVGKNRDDGFVTPLLNNAGRIKDFRYSMSKEDKEVLLNMDRKVSRLVGKGFAKIVDKRETKTFNQQLLDLIVKDAEENLKAGNKSKIGRNQKEYIKIHKDSLHGDVKEIWRILPSDVKLSFPDGFTLRRDLMFSYLGYRELSIVDLLGVKQNRDNKGYSGVLVYALQFAEKLWKEIIKISKADIIIRTPGVFIGNVVSNFLLAYMSGYSVKDIVKLKYQGVKELKTYVDGLKESIKLELKQEAGLITAVETRRLNVIKNNLNNSPVKDLVDEGFYTTIVEELEIGTEDSGSYFNRYAKRKLANSPKIFSDAVDILYITENTKLFKLIEKGIQASDFAARYAQYHIMLAKGVKKDKAIKIVRDNYINYNKPNSRFIEWVNQMGFVMFTKYFTRIQRVIRDYSKNHPSKLFLAFLGQEYLVGDLDDITDQSIFTKDVSNLGYSSLENLMRVLTPSSLEAVDWAINKAR